MIELKNNPAGNFFLLAGPCVIEGEEMAMRIAISSPSMTHGPASRKKFPAGLFFNSIIGCY